MNAQALQPLGARSSISSMNNTKPKVEVENQSRLGGFGSKLLNPR